MADQSLVERILGARGTLSAAVNTAAATDSVIKNLRQIFNARQGCSTSRPDFGMPEFGDLMHGFPQVIPEIVRAIKYQVEQFEPRLTNVQVRHRTDTEDLATVRFSIRATLVSDGNDTPVLLDGALGADGHLDVRG